MFEIIPRLGKIGWEYFSMVAKNYKSVWLIFYWKKLIIERKLWSLKCLFKKNMVEIWLKFLLNILLKSFINFLTKVRYLKRLIHLKLLQSIFLYIMMLSILSYNLFGCKYWFVIKVGPLQYKVWEILIFLGCNIYRWVVNLLRFLMEGL